MVTQQCLCRRTSLNSFINLARCVWWPGGILWSGGGRSETLPGHYLEQEATQMHCTHLRKGHGENGEQWRIASPSNYWSWLPLYVTQCATAASRHGLPGCDLKNFWCCFVNLRVLCFGGLMEGWWNYSSPLLIFVVASHRGWTPLVNFGL